MRLQTPKTSANLIQGFWSVGEKVATVAGNNKSILKQILFAKIIRFYQF